MIKKEIVITFRTDAEVKKLLDEIAQEKEWSLSQVVEKMCRDCLKDKLQKDNG